MSQGNRDSTFIGLILGNDSEQYATGVCGHIMYCVLINTWTATKKGEWAINGKEANEPVI
jgi:hypothetical protein